MKKSVLKLGMVSMILIGMVSCKNKEKELADQRISELEYYVDSLKTVSEMDRQANWDKISEDFETKKNNANSSLSSLDAEIQTESKSKIAVSNAKYDSYKEIQMGNSRVETTSGTVAKTVNPSQLLRDRLFGAGKIGNDMNFGWVNKNNILSVYNNFFESYKANKSDFSREDYDEIKLMYEALDSRKNTVENEGLSSDDNGKIASIKFKFAPMFKVNRIGAKSRENDRAKE